VQELLPLIGEGNPDGISNRWPHIERFLRVDDSTGRVEDDFHWWWRIEDTLSPTEQVAANEEWAEFYEWRLAQRAAELAGDRVERHLVSEWTDSMAYCCRRSAAWARGEDPDELVPQSQRRPDLHANSSRSWPRSSKSWTHAVSRPGNWPRLGSRGVAMISRYVELYGLPCGLFGRPASHSEVFPNGVRTAHLEWRKRPCDSAGSTASNQPDRGVGHGRFPGRRSRPGEVRQSRTEDKIRSHEYEKTDGCQVTLDRNTSNLTALCRARLATDCLLKVVCLDRVRSSGQP